MTDAQIEEAFNLTKSSIERRGAMVAALTAIERDKIKGDIVECGVFLGGNIIVARAYCPERLCWLYDTFAGAVPPDPELDIHINDGGRAIGKYNKITSAGGRWMAASLQDVRRKFRYFNLLDETYLRFVEGPVEKTLLKPGNVPKEIALLRLDTDWYASTKIELEILYPRLVKHGILIIDDYGHWAGCQKAVDDYFQNQTPVWHQIDYSAVMMVKS